MAPFYVSGARCQVFFPLRFPTSPILAAWQPAALRVLPAVTGRAGAFTGPARFERHVAHDARPRPQGASAASLASNQAVHCTVAVVIHPLPLSPRGLDSKGGKLPPSEAIPCPRPWARLEGLLGRILRWLPCPPPVGSTNRALAEPVPRHSLPPARGLDTSGQRTPLAGTPGCHVRTTAPGPHQDAMLPALVPQPYRPSCRPAPCTGWQARATRRRPRLPCPEPPR